eukprot:Nk52_evm2s2377 gene=Nk52_evmTU2s2377
MSSDTLNVFELALALPVEAIVILVFLFIPVVASVSLSKRLAKQHQALVSSHSSSDTPGPSVRVLTASNPFRSSDIGISYRIKQVSVRMASLVQAGENSPLIRDLLQMDEEGIAGKECPVRFGIAGKLPRLLLRKQLGPKTSLGGYNEILRQLSRVDVHMFSDNATEHQQFSETIDQRVKEFNEENALAKCKIFHAIHTTVLDSDGEGKTCVIDEIDEKVNAAINKAFNMAHLSIDQVFMYKLNPGEPTCDQFCIVFTECCEFDLLNDIARPIAPCLYDSMSLRMRVSRIHGQTIGACDRLEAACDPFSVADAVIAVVNGECSEMVLTRDTWAHWRKEQLPCEVLYYALMHSIFSDKTEAFYTKMYWFLVTCGLTPRTQSMNESYGALMCEVNEKAVRLTKRRGSPQRLKIDGVGTQEFYNWWISEVEPLRCVLPAFSKQMKREHINMGKSLEKGNQLMPFVGSQRSDVTYRDVCPPAWLNTQQWMEEVQFDELEDLDVSFDRHRASADKIFRIVRDLTRLNERSFVYGALLVVLATLVQLVALNAFGSSTSIGILFGFIALFALWVVILNMSVWWLLQASFTAMVEFFTGLFGNLFTLDDYTWQYRMRTSELLYRLSGDSAAFSSLISETFPAIVTGVVSIPILTLVLLVYEYRAGLTVVQFLAFLCATLVVYTVWGRKQNRVYRMRNGALAAYLYQCLDSVHAIASTNSVTFHAEKYSQNLLASLKSAQVLQTADQCLRVVIRGSELLTVHFIIFYLGISTIINGDTSRKDLCLTIAYFLFTEAVLFFSQSAEGIIQSGSLERLFVLSNYQAPSHRNPTAEQLAQSTNIGVRSGNNCGQFEGDLHDSSYMMYSRGPQTQRYDHDRQWTIIIRDLKFAFPSNGKKVTLNLPNESVIESGKVTTWHRPRGSGTSSLFSILQRQVSYSLGSIFLGGIPLHFYSTKFLAQNIAVISHDETLLPRNVTFNINYSTSPSAKSTQDVLTKSQYSRTGENKIYDVRHELAVGSTARAVAPNDDNNIYIQMTKMPVGSTTSAPPASSYCGAAPVDIDKDQSINTNPHEEPAQRLQLLAVAEALNIPPEFLLDCKSLAEMPAQTLLLDDFQKICVQLARAYLRHCKVYLIEDPFRFVPPSKLNQCRLVLNNFLNNFVLVDVAARPSNISRCVPSTGACTASCTDDAPAVLIVESTTINYNARVF